MLGQESNFYPLVQQLSTYDYDMLCGSFTDALHEKYGEEMEDKEGNPCEFFVVGRSPGRSSPGGRLILPYALTLNCCGIDNAGSQRTIEELCRDVEELDLAQNHLSDLREVNYIISKMPNLWFLNLSHNDMEDAVPVCIDTARNVRSLVLNHTSIPWPVVNSLLDAMPNVQELHLSLNNYTSVELDSNKQYYNLKRVHISGNPLCRWEEVTHIGHCFPHLDTLIMVNCSIESVPDPETWKNEFQNLHTFNMKNGALKDWTDVERLNAFPMLEDIRILGISVLEGLSEKERRQHLIARLPCAKRLNGSPVTAKEREDAERSFIRFFLDKEDRPQRVYELEAIHGKLNPLVNIDLSPKKTARVSIRYHEQNETCITRVINLHHSVHDLKVQFGQICKLPPTKMRVFYIDQDMAGVHGPEELRYNTKKLYTYNIQDGDEFLVDRK